MPTAPKSSNRNISDELREKLTLRSMRELQIAYDMSSTAVSQWKNRGMPVLPNGHYFIPDISAWLNADRAEAPEKVQQRENRQKKEELDRQKVELQVQKARLELLDQQDMMSYRDEVVVAQRQQNTEIKMALLSLPRNAAKSLPPEIQADVLAELQRQIDLLLRSLAQKSKEWKESSDGSE